MNEKDKKACEAAMPEGYANSVTLIDVAFETGFAAACRHKDSTSPSWTPVSEGLPKSEDIYLVHFTAFNKDGEVVGEYDAVRFLDANEDWLDDTGREDEYADVVAYRPIPPYQQTKDGGGER